MFTVIVKDKGDSKFQNDDELILDYVDGELDVVVYPMSADEQFKSSIKYIIDDQIQFSFMKELT